MAAKTLGRSTFSDPPIRDEHLASEFHEAERERKKRAAKAKRLQELQSHGSIHDLKAHPELIPPYIFYPEILKGEIAVIYGGPDVDLSELLFQIALAAAEGPSPDFKNLRTKSGRDSTLGIQCRHQCRVQIVFPHSTWHRSIASLRPHLLVATSSGIARDLSWFCPEAIRRNDDQDFDEPPRPIPLELRQDFDLIVYDLSDVDDRLTNDYSCVASYLDRHRRRNPLDRPALVFIVNEGALRRTWRTGVWKGCDLVLRAQSVTEEPPPQTIQLIPERFSSLLDTDVPAESGLLGPHGDDMSKPKEQTSQLLRFVELWRVGIRSDAELTRKLKRDRTTIWRYKGEARARGLIGPEDDE